jgi:hypothetical protein
MVSALARVKLQPILRIARSATRRSTWLDETG